MMITAGIGVDFALTVLERSVHIKPSFEWILQDDVVKGVVGYAESISAFPDQCPCRTGFARGVSTEAFNGIGPGLEIEAEASRFGPFQISVFAAAQAYYRLDDEVVVTASGEFSDGSGLLTVRSTYERDPWDYRAGVGVRFHWLPE